MSNFNQAKNKGIEDFEKEFVLRPFEPDGDYSWNYVKLTPYQVKEFLSSYADSIKEAVEKDIFGSEKNARDSFEDYIRKDARNKRSARLNKNLIMDNKELKEMKKEIPLLSKWFLIIRFWLIDKILPTNCFLIGDPTGELRELLLSEEFEKLGRRYHAQKTNSTPIDSDNSGTTASPPLG